MAYSVNMRHPLLLFYFSFLRQFFKGIFYCQGSFVASTLFVLCLVVTPLPALLDAAHSAPLTRNTEFESTENVNNYHLIYLCVDKLHVYLSSWSGVFHISGSLS